MTVLATATIAGPEARGQAQLVQGDDGGVSLELDEFWIASGAPDVRLYVSPEPAGIVTNSAIDLGHVPDRQATLIMPLLAEVDPASLRSVIVHCTIYSVRFGHGTLNHTNDRTRP